MRTSIRQKIKKFLVEYGKNNHWRKAAVCMAAVVMVLTSFALILPAITMGRETYCGTEEHKHTEKCYEKQLVCVKEVEENKRVLSCALELHQHQAGCYNSDGEIICGYADYVVHEHAANCYDADGTLVCTLPEVKEHTHDASCYTEEKQLVCTTAETAGHTHTEACYTMVETGNINCIAPEEEGHVHTEECYEKANTLTCGQQEEPGHTHADNCYEAVRHYTCGKQEVILHKHDEVQCYSTDDNGNRYLSCGKPEVLSHEHDDKCFKEVEGEKHTHTEECYEEKAVCEKDEHTHEDSCFDKKSAETETVKQSESDNSAETAETVETTETAEATETVETTETAETTETEQTVWTTQDNKSEVNAAETECGKEEHTHAEDCYSNSGDFICELEEHTHELTCYSEEVQNAVKEVNQAIEALPTYEELSEKFAAYEEAGDEDGYNTYYQEIAAQVKAAYEAYNALDEKLHKFIPAENVEALNSYASFLVMDPPEIADVANTDLGKYLQSVTLTDAKGNPVSDKVYIGENYKIALGFAESEGNQFNTAVDTWTYHLPLNLLVTEAQSQKMTITITENNIPKKYEVTYDIIADDPGTEKISNDGLLTIHLTDELKEAVGQSPNVSFNVELDAQVSSKNTGDEGEIVFQGFGTGTTFQISARPIISVKKTGKATESKDDNGNSTGGVLTYTITGNVQNGPIKGITFTDKAGYPEAYFGNLNTIKNHFKITSAAITCKHNTSGHGKTLRTSDYTLEWADDGTFTLKVNNEISMDDCDEIVVKYSIPYTSAQGVNYYTFDVDNTVSFNGTAVQKQGRPIKENPVPATVTTQVTVKGGTVGIKGIVKRVDDTHYDAIGDSGVLHYTIETAVRKREYDSFYMTDHLTILLDGETYWVDAAPKNMKVTITDKKGEKRPINLGDRDQDWYEHINTPDYKLPSENYYAYYGKGIPGLGEWMKGVFDIPFNPTGQGDWGNTTSLSIQEDSTIKVTYDINVNEEVGIYKLDEATNQKILKDTITIKGFLADTDGAAILRNNIQMIADGHLAGSTVDYGRCEKLKKTAGGTNSDGTEWFQNPDGTVDYSVTLFVDNAVREVIENNEQKDTSYKGLNIDFYDDFQDGWEYVRGSLTATMNFGTWAGTFYYLDNFDEKQYGDESFRAFLDEITGNKISPVTADGDAIKASWNGFVERLADGSLNPWWSLASSTRWTDEAGYKNLEKLVSITFNYTLRPTDEFGKSSQVTEDSNGDGFAEMPVIPVNNDAEIQFGNGAPYTAHHGGQYTPKALSKTAKQNVAGSNVISFEVEINPAGVDLNPNGETIKVIDTMGENLTLNTNNDPIVNVKDRNGKTVSGYEMKTDKENNHEQIILTGLPDDQYLKICYEALITEQGDGIKVSNTALIEGVAETRLDDNTEFDISNTSGSGQGSINYFKIRKVDKDNEQKNLEGAEFNIYKAKQTAGGAYKFNGEGGQTEYSAELIQHYVSDKNGMIEVRDAEKVQLGGYYILEETKAPKGYMKQNEPILLYFAGVGEVPANVDKNAKVIGHTYLYIVKNEAYKVELPETGGIGTIPYTMAGIALIVMSAMLYTKESKKGRKSKR